MKLIISCCCGNKRTVYADTTTGLLVEIKRHGWDRIRTNVAREVTGRCLTCSLLDERGVGKAGVLGLRKKKRRKT